MNSDNRVGTAPISISALSKTLESATTCPPGLPSRVFICGISALPPVYLQALQALGKHIEIHLLFTNLPLLLGRY